MRRCCRCGVDLNVAMIVLWSCEVDGESSLHNGYVGGCLDDMCQAVLSGAIPESAVDDSVSRILTMMYKFGLFDHYDQVDAHIYVLCC